MVRFEIIKLFSSNMEDYLTKHTDILSVSDYAEMVCGAPISIYRKIKYLDALKHETDNADEIALLDELINYAQEALSEIEALPKDGSALLTTPYWFDTDNESFKGHSVSFPAASLEGNAEAILDNIESDSGIRDFSSNTNTWYETVKWNLIETDSIKSKYEHGKYRYIFINGDICYIEPFEYPRGPFDDYYTKHYGWIVNSSNLNLPVPFAPGDIVIIDCRPFAPEENLLITSVGDNKDCCSLRCAFIDHKGQIQFTSVKHSHCFPGNYRSRVSPLYSIKLQSGLKAEDDKLSKLRDLILAQEEGYRDKFGDNLEYANEILCQ